MALEDRLKQEWIKDVQKTMSRLLWLMVADSFQNVRRHHVAEVDEGHFMEGQEC